MKKITQFLFFFSFLIYVSSSNCQQVDSTDLFYFVEKEKWKLIEDIADKEGVDVTGLREYKHFINWQNHFKTKIGEDGSMSAFGEAVNNYYDSNDDVDGAFELSWQYNSPETLWPLIGWPNPHYGSGQGLIISLWVEKDSINHILAGGQYSGGLWETRDGGNNWINISENEPMIQGISSIYVSPHNEDNIFITTTYDAEGPSGYANGLFFTHNHGETWEIDSCFVHDDTVSNYYYPQSNSHISPRVFLRHPRDTTLMYLCTVNKLLRSTNNGESWYVIHEREKADGYYAYWMGHQFFNDMKFDQNDPSILYLGGPEMFRFTYNGDSIENITDSILNFPGNTDTVFRASRIAVDSAYPNKIWFSICRVNDSLLIVEYDKLTNTYNHWRTDTKINQLWMLCDISPVDSTHLVIGGRVLNLFDLQGDTIVQKNIGGGLHNDMRSCQFSKDLLGNEVLLIGTDGGISRYDNPFDSTGWSYIANDGTNGIRNLDVQGFDVSDKGKDIMAIGTSHNGMILKEDGEFMKIFGGGDQQSILIDPIDPNNIYAVQYGHSELEASNDMGESSWNFYDGYDYKAPLPILFFQPNDPKVLYVGAFREILEFNTDSLSLSISPTEHAFTTAAIDSLSDMSYVQEVGISPHLDSMFFFATDRYQAGWLGTTNQYAKVNGFLKAEIGSAGLSFTDLTLNLDNGFAGGMVTGIAVEVNVNDTIIYTSFGTTRSSSNAMEQKKVYYSKDMGVTWYPMATGLDPEIPVNDIKYHDNSGMLYLVNDVGVYYYDRSDSTWMNVTDSLPPTSFAHIRFSNKKHSILVGSHAKGVWEAEMPCFNDSLDIEITTNTTWSSAGYPVHGNIIIDSGAVLTIKNEVYMPNCARIIVERGGKLILDGGKITNACDYFWAGIEVRGTTSANQTASAQGWVEIINGGVVENSEYGIYTGKTLYCGGGWASGYSGGILECDSAYFINNKLSVQFTTYSTDYSDSYFENTTFEINDEYIGINDDPEYLVKVYGMKEVRFENCMFVNNASDYEYLTGLYCYNSIVGVYGECLSGSPCQDWDETEFIDLRYGIQSYASSSPTSYLDVRNTIFHENFRGIYISGTDNCRITSNTFEINTPFVTNGGCGLYLDASTGYWIEENSFEYDLDPPKGVGIVVANSGGDQNEIYRNNFVSLEQGISCQEQNRSSSITDQGLQILCNDFDDCTADIAVPEPQRTGLGVKYYQGVNGTDPEDMAGNMFYIESSTSDGDYDDWWNLGAYIKYVYPGNPATGYGDVEPVDITDKTIGLVNNTTSTDWEFEEGCPSQISTGGGFKSSGNNDYRELLNYYAGLVDEMELLLSGIIDGGNTDELNTDVEMSTPPEAMEIYSELINKSPNLSETVVGTAIDKETVLPNSMIRDVMVANPHVAASDVLIEYLDERITVMPDYMKAQILESRDNVSVKEELESKLGGYRLRQARAFNGLIRQFYNETDYFTQLSDSLVALFQDFDDINVKYRLAMIHLNNENSQTGSLILDSILDANILNDDQMLEYSDFVEYYSIVQEAQQDNRTTFELTENEMGQLNSLMQEGDGLARVYSRNILIANDAIEYLAPIQVPDLLKSIEIEKNYNELLNSKHPQILSVYPNPSKDYIILEYHLEHDKGGLIEIRNIDGVLVDQKSISRIDDQVTIGTHGWKPGTYIVTLRLDGKFIESVKFTLIN